MVRGCVVESLVERFGCFLELVFIALPPEPAMFRGAFLCLFLRLFFLESPAQNRTVAGGFALKAIKQWIKKAALRKHALNRFPETFVKIEGLRCWFWGRFGRPFFKKFAWRPGFEGFGHRFLPFSRRKSSKPGGAGTSAKRTPPRAWPQGGGKGGGFLSLILNLRSKILNLNSYLNS